MKQERVIALAAACCLAAGCATELTSRQLERVAKDWCLSVRASQVIPVYPLTEDVQPGDVFLVQTPYEDQVQVYKDKGFLPLENLLVRLHPSSYQTFYSSGYGVKDEKVVPPRHWQFPDGGAAADFAPAPRAAFPTYSFSVSRSSGLSVAVPVNAVPLGLNLLDAESADGTIAIKDCYTYGTALFEMQAIVQSWAASNQAFVRQFKSRPAINDEPGTQFYLRVINRVYLTKQVDVSLFATEALGGSLSAGAPSPVDLLNLGKSDVGNAAKNFDDVNALLDKAGGLAGGGGVAPGGTVRVTAAASRSVTLAETFARPLVIGYLAFDLPIMSDGEIGAPVSTQAQLEQRPVAIGEALKWEKDEMSDRILNWVKGNQQNYDRLVKWLADNKIDADPADIRTGWGYAEVRRRAVRELNIPE